MEKKIENIKINNLGYIETKPLSSNILSIKQRMQMGHYIIYSTDKNAYTAKNTYCKC